jgi:Lon protease-like protein
MLPFVVPIFPLPNVVLFPNVFLPLHIFEPRYRQMTEDALAGDRIIGMVLLRPGYEADYHGAPPIYPVGCSGLITHSEILDDGRYNLVLRGLEKFSIQSEEPPAAGRQYRSAVIAPVHEPVTAGQRMTLRLERIRLQKLLAEHYEGLVEARLPEAMPDEDLINALAQYLEFEPMERLALLERPGALARCRSIIELLEMKIMMRESGNGEPGRIH